MPSNLRELRRKMKGVKSTRQVTHAMELVAASKMRRAVENAQNLRRYALTAYNILEHIAETNPEIHPYLATDSPPKNILAILFTSDRGLCGSLNAQLLRATLEYISRIQSLPSFHSMDFMGVGKKGMQFLARAGQNVVLCMPALSNNPTFRDTLPITKFAVENYLNGTYDHVVLLHSDFRSALRQLPTIKVLLPLSKTSLKDMVHHHIAEGHIMEVSEEEIEKEAKLAVAEYLFEPDPNVVASTIVPKLTESQIYQAVLETAASEHSARMVAMKNATDSASDILDDLTLTYNRTRQAAITAELADLSATKAALE